MSLRPPQMNWWFHSIIYMLEQIQENSGIYRRNFRSWLENRFGPGERGPDWNFFLGHFYWPSLTDWLIFIVVSRSSIKPWDFFQRSPSLSRPLRVYDLMGQAWPSLAFSIVSTQRLHRESCPDTIDWHVMDLLRNKRNNSPNQIFFNLHRTLGGT